MCSHIHIGCVAFWILWSRCMKEYTIEARSRKAAACITSLTAGIFSFSVKEMPKFARIVRVAFTSRAFSVFRMRIPT
ncbi:unnamed protein product [Amoebophrya sp. A120]|nr:unnamed protein product [Amoebophrya sp. A120]|eukprot:GSA120T00015299001.1